MEPFLFNPNHYMAFYKHPAIGRAHRSRKKHINCNTDKMNRLHAKFAAEKAGQKFMKRSTLIRKLAQASKVGK